jgi:hypothetical protein
VATMNWLAMLWAVATAGRLKPRGEPSPALREEQQRRAALSAGSV